MNKSNPIKLMKLAGVMLAAAILAAICSFSVINYTHVETCTLTVYSINVEQNVSSDSHDKVSTIYSYHVATDKGLYEIAPKGLYASLSFGVLEPGNTYLCTTRGYRYTYLGIYPYIISAIKTQ